MSAPSPQPAQQALDQVSRLLDVVVDGMASEPPTNPQLQLLAFCLQRLGVSRPVLHPHAGNLVELLDFNNINHREVIPPRDPRRQNSPLLLVFRKDDDEPLALWRQGRRNWFYSAVEDRQWLADRATTIRSDLAYEIYPSLPSRLRHWHQLVHFTFSSDVTALVSLLVASAVVTLFGLAIPMITNYLVTEILPQSQRRLLLDNGVVVLLVICASIATQYLQNLMVLRLQSVTDLRLQTALWDHVMRLPMAFLQQFTTADLESRVSAITRIRQQLSTGLISSLLSSVFAAVYFLLMVGYDRGLALVAGLFSAMGLVLVLTMIGLRLKSKAQLEQAGAEATNFAMQAMLGVAQIRSAGAEPFLFVRWLRILSKATRQQTIGERYADLNGLYAALVSPLATLLLFVVLIQRVSASGSGGLTPALVVPFVSFYVAYGAFNSTVSNAVSVLASIAGDVLQLWRRASPVMFAAEEAGYAPEASRPVLEGTVRFQGIAYQYPKTSQPLLRDISFTVPAGSYTVITGPSGTGKSTLLKMVLGFIAPDSGDLLIDNLSISQLAIRPYRRQLGVVMQDAELLAGSIYEIVSGGQSLGDEVVWQALEFAAVANEVRSMPMGIDTPLSNRSSGISGGQRQRIAIARALVHKPQILLMDEATSSLDAGSQQQITSTIRNLGITRLSIAHRLSTMRDADQIVVIENGLVSQQGNWQELEHQEGFLRRMSQQRSLF